MKVLAILLCAILVLGGIASAVLYYTPQAASINALVGATKDISKRAELQPLAGMLKEGSLEFSLSEVEYDNENIMEDSNISGKIYFSKDATMIQALDIIVRDEVSLSGSAYFSNDLIYVEGENLIGGAYGVTPKKFTSDLAKSIFAADSGSEYAIADESLYDAVLRSGKNLDLNKMQRDADKLIETYERELWLIVCKYAEFDSNFKKVDLNGTKKTARVITITVTPEDMAHIVEDAYDYLDNDEQILKFFKTYESAFALMFGELYDASEYESLADVVEEWIDDAEDTVEKFCNELEDSEAFETIELEVVTQTIAATLLKTSLKVDGVTAFTLDLGTQGMKNTDQITLKSFENELVYTMKQYDDRSVATLKANEEKLISVTVNKIRNTFKIETETLTMSGAIQTKEGKTTMTIDKVVETYFNGTAYVSDEYKTNFRLVIRQEDEMPEAPTKYNRIYDITEEDVEAWIEKFEQTFAEPEDDPIEKFPV